MIIGFFLLRKYYQTEGGKTVMDRLLLKLPVFGPLFQKIAVARFSRTLGTLVSSGVPILDGLNIVSRAAGNKTIETAILNARASIREGETIAEPLNRSAIFPPMVIQMISVGESTGALDSMLGKIADFYDDEVDAAVAALTALLEPLLMVFLGIVIGIMAIVGMTSIIRGFDESVRDMIRQMGPKTVYVAKSGPMMGGNRQQFLEIMKRPNITLADAQGPQGTGLAGLRRIMFGQGGPGSQGFEMLETLQVT
jgi:hypothetical protein